MTGVTGEVTPQSRHLPPAATAGPPSARPGADVVRPLLAFLARDLAGRRLLRLPLLLDLTFGIVNLLVFLFISRVLHLPDGTHDLAHAASYFDFVAVGITVMLVLQAASTQLTARISTEQRAGTLEMLMAQPVSVWGLTLGLAGYPFLFALVRTGFYLGLLSLLFGMHVGRTDWLGVALVLVLGSSAMLGIGVVLMAFTVAVGHGGAAARLVVVGLSFVSGTYFPVSALPAPIDPLTVALPTRLALDGLRAAIGGGQWGSAALALLAVTAVLLPVSVWLFGWALRLAARRGVLTRG